MTQLSFPWPDTTDPGPQIGDGRAYTDAEWDEYFEALHAGMRSTLSGIVRCWNELAVTSPGANTLAVSTGKAIVNFQYPLADRDLGKRPPPRRLLNHIRLLRCPEAHSRPSYTHTSTGAAVLRPPPVAPWRKPPCRANPATICACSRHGTDAHRR